VENVENASKFSTKGNTVTCGNAVEREDTTKAATNTIIRNCMEKTSPW
jgi:hypothetical protein